MLVSNLVAQCLDEGKQRILACKKHGEISDAITFNSFPGILSGPDALDGSSPLRSSVMPVVVISICGIFGT